MRNFLIFFTAILLFSIAPSVELRSQARYELCNGNDCPCLRRQAKQFEKDGRYSEAINLYQAYGVCQPDSQLFVSRKITGLYERSQELTNLALKAKKEAEEQKKIADKQRIAAGNEKDRAKKRARANHNLAVTLSTLQQNPTMAIRMAEFSANNDPDDSGIQQVYSDIISNSDNYFYRRCVFRGHRADITDMALSPDGRIILTSGRDSTARIWNQEGQQLHVFESLPGEAAFVYFSQKGGKIIVGNISWVMIGDTSGRKSSTVIRSGKERGSAVAFSPEGDRWAFGDFTGCLRLLDFNGQLIDSFITNNGRINRVVFSSDGKHILGCGESGVSTIWNIKSDRKSVELRGHTEGVLHGAFSPEGDSVLTVSNDHTIRIWNLKGDSLGIITLNSSLKRAFFIGGDSVLVQYDEDKSGRAPVLVDLKRTKTPRRFSELKNLTYYSPRFTNNRLLVLAKSKPDSDIPGDDVLTVRIFGKDGGYRGRFVMSSKGDWPELVNSTPEQDIIMCFKYGNSFESYQFGNRRPVTYAPDKSKTVPPELEHDTPFSLPYAAFTPDGKMFFYHLPDDSTVIVRNLADGPKKTPLRLQKKNCFTKTIAVNPKLNEKSKYAFLTLNSDSSISLFDQGARERWSPENTESPTLQALFSSDGQQVLTLHADSTFQLWNPEINQRRRIGKYNSGLFCAAISPDGTTIAVAGNDQRVHLWSVEEQKEKQIFPDLGASVAEVSFLPDNQRFLVRTYTKEVSLWHVSQPEKPLKTWRGYWTDGELLGWEKAILSPKGNQILLIGDGEMATLTDLKGENVYDLIGHESSIATAVFSEDEKYILTAGQDNTARLWDPQGKPLAVYRGEQQGGIQCTAISPDGRRALTLDGEGAAYLWKTPKELLENGIEQFSSNELAENDLLPDPAHFNFDTITHTKVLFQTATNFLKQQDTATAHKLFDYLVNKFNVQNDEVWYKWYITGGCRACDWDTLMSKAQALYPIAERFKRDKRYAEAQKIYEHLIENDEETAPPLWDYFEVCEAGKGKVNKRLFLDETNPEKLVSYAQFFQSEGDDQTARSLLKKSLQTQSSAQGIIGLTKINKAEDQSFIQERIAALTDVGERLRLADYFREKGDDAHAVELYHAILKNEEIPEANIGLYEIGLRNPAYPFRPEQLLASTSAQALRQYAYYFGEKGDETMKLSMLERIIDIGKADSYDYFERYLIFESRGNDTFNSLLELNSPAALRGLMSYFASQGWFESQDSALVYYKKAAQLGERLVNLEDTPENREALSRQYNSLGWYGLFAGDFENSEKAIRQGIKVFPDNLYLYTNLPHALLFQGKFDAAKKEYLQNESREYAPDRGKPFMRDAYFGDFNSFKTDFKGNPATRFTKEMMDDVARIEKELKDLPPITTKKKG